MQAFRIIDDQVIVATGEEAGGHSAIGDSLTAHIVVTGISGTTPSATFSVLWSDDGVTYSQASPADAFAPITNLAGVVERFDVKGAFYKLAWVISGTSPSFTTTISTTTREN